MFITMMFKLSALNALFFPMTVIFFGIALILPNISSIAMSSVSDKSHGSAVMNFTNIGTLTLAV
ncbi:MAG: hypothetical protein AB7F64_04900 [Gammaproteobacteria bacterium]